MPKIRAALAAAAVVLGLAVTIAPAEAEVDFGWYPKRLASNVACVRADFPVAGSGWKLQAAVAAWNVGQSSVRLTLAEEPGCARISVHRYSADNGAAAFTDYPGMVVPADGSPQTYSTVDIYLNDFYGTRSTSLLSRVTIEHELGHALGLPHSESPRSVMSLGYEPGYNIGRWRGRINPIDVRNLAALYRTSALGISWAPMAQQKSDPGRCSNTAGA